MEGLLRKPAPPQGNDGGAPGWMVTYADLMTLLLTFFILLVAMSTMQEERIKVALGSLRGALGVLEGGGKTVKGRRELVALRELHADTQATPTNVNRSTPEPLAKYHANKHIQIGHVSDSVRIVIDESLMFEEGSDEVQPGAYPFLSDLGEVIATAPWIVEFHGHTDDRGSANNPRLNWEIGARRAISVMQYVREHADVGDDELRVISYGDSQPRVPNSSADNRRRNRRVEIVLTTHSHDALDAVESMRWSTAEN